MEKNKIKNPVLSSPVSSCYMRSLWEEGERMFSALYHTGLPQLILSDV